MTKNYIHLHDLVFNKPHLCTPEYAETVLAVLKEKFNLEEGASSPDLEGRNPKDANLRGSLQIIPIVGSMVHRGGSLDALSGIQSYQSIQAQIQEALDNPQVKQILLEMDSPGGSVAGAFDLKDFILKAKQEKPIYAIANDTMASAAYLIGSACTEVYATQTAQVGSIGVVAMHLDQSEKNRQEGVKPTFIYAGDFKTAGNPHQPLEGEPLAYLTQSVNDSYEMFVNAVASNRSVDAQVIRDTEARVYRGETAKELGLVDGVMSMDSLLENLAKDSQQRVSMSVKGKKMDKETIEKLEADFAQVSADLESTKATNESLTKALLENGFKITKDGVEKAEAEEFMEFGGEKVAKSQIPSAVLKALEEANAEKAEANLKEKASKELPNFDIEVAKALVSANLDENTMKALKAADTMFESMMEESGETHTQADMEDPKEQMNALVEAYMEEHSTNIHKARTEVAKTAKGRELQKAMLKG